ncbi:MAG: type II toxin-antitoxin system VapC family toxin [Rhizobiaceae bacterium]|nr:MAG: type II toxin-antitoxin system VapC family toxin [Rhizobiaceae bacterium]
MTSVRYMLDTNIVSALIRWPDGSTKSRLLSVGEESVCVSAIGASELRFGAVRRRSARLISQVEDVLSRMLVIDYNDAASIVYADIRAQLEVRGTLIGSNDLFIAAHARSLDLTLVTDNIREFSRVDGLKLENWIDREAADV